MFACKSSRKIVADRSFEPLSKDSVIVNFAEQTHLYQTASFRAKIDYTEKKKQTFTANIRMVRDSIIWASFTGTLGVEGARAIITPDSIFILDKLNKIYYQKPFGYINEFVPFTVTLSFLQDLIIGKHTLQADTKTDFSVDKAYLIKQDTDNLSSAYTIDPFLFVPLLVKLQEKQGNRQAQFIYKDYRKQDEADESNFSYARYVEFKSGKKIKIDIRFSKTSWNEDLSFPFSVGEKYEIRY